MLVLRAAEPLFVPSQTSGAASACGGHAEKVKLTLAVFNYVHETIRTHPFNFFMLLLTLAAAGFAGLSWWEARQTRLEASKAALEQAQNVERARKAAENSAKAASDLVQATKDSVGLAAQSLDLNKTVLSNSEKSFQIQQRPYLSASVARVYGPGVNGSLEKVCCRISLQVKIQLTNLGNTPAYGSELTFKWTSAPRTISAAFPDQILPKDSAEEEAFIYNFRNLDEFLQSTCRSCYYPESATLRYRDIFGKRYIEHLTIDVPLSRLSEMEWVNMRRAMYGVAGVPVPKDFR